MTMQIVRAALRAPALHFLLLGGLLFAVASTGVDPVEAPRREPIVISAARIEEIRRDYAQTLGAVPTPEELAALVAREADDEMLYREALLLGLDRGDPAVEWRIIEKMEFLYGDAVESNEQALRRGLELGLQRDDAVVRSGLITKMRLLAKGASRSEEPRGEELEATLREYFESHREDYQQPEQLTFVHVFVSGGDAARETEARELAGRLAAARTSPEEAISESDAFVTGNVARAASRGGLAKIFGEVFAETVAGLEEGRWSDPIRSPYGFHVVWLSEKRAAGTPELGAVRSRVLHAYRADRQQQRLEELLAEIRRAYEVRIEAGEPGDA